MYPLHKDMLLNEQQQQIVLDYIKEITFSLPGTTPDEYTVVPMAKYVGWNFKGEDLESYAVGLVCTKPGFEQHRTFIRMSYGQLLGHCDALRLPVNKPVLGNQLLRLQRYRDSDTGPTRTGVDAYQQEDGSVPGADMDLDQLHGVLADINRFASGVLQPAFECKFDLNLDLGTLLAGRYPRLKYYEEQGRLKPEQLERLHEFETTMTSMEELLIKMDLPTLASVRSPEDRKHDQHHSKVLRH